MRGWLTVLMVGLAFSPAQGSDLEREARLAAEIEDTIVVGEPIYLTADGHDFLALYTPAEPARGSTLILHGRGYHPDWPLVAAPLREGLADAGWTTLSIQLPVLAKDAGYYDYVPVFPEAAARIRSALIHLRTMAADEPTIVIAHSCGVHMAMAYVDIYGDSDFDGFVGIGMGATDYGQPMRQPFPLASMGIPVLDIFGADEFPGVLRMAPERKAGLAAGGNPGSRQFIVPDAEHYFEGDAASAQLLETIAEWLDTTDFRRNQQRPTRQ
jgi:predicted alpha/beta-hydrolase family hydrolase